MARYSYTGISAGAQAEITPQWPCTLMIYDDSGGRVYIEVKGDDGEFHRFPALRFYSGIITPLDLPGCTVRVSVESTDSITVELIEGGA